MRHCFRLRAWVLCACAALSAAAFSDNLAIACAPVFPGVPATESYPLLVEVENKGPDAHGEVALSGPNLVLHYPIDLPRGSDKRFIAYPEMPSGESLKIDLNTDQGRIHQTFLDNADYSAVRRILTITDNEGESHFLHGVRANKSAAVGDYYVKPELAPERSPAYNRFFAIILGEGAERLSQAQVAALKTFVLNGGTLLFIGGAAPIAPKDPRWSDFLPVHNLRTRTLDGAKFVIWTPHGWEQIPETLSNPITLSIGDTAPGAQTRAKVDGFPVAFSQPVGAGTVVYFAANPYDAPLNGTDFRAGLVGGILNLRAPQGVAGLLSIMAGTDAYSSYGSYRYTSYSYYRGSGGSGYVPSLVSDPRNPFQVKLPPLSSIALVLLCYLLLVAPINLLVLRKLGRGELAWITAPAISFVFAGIFFRYAANLYSAKQSALIGGVLLADAHSGDSYLIGKAQLFFPRGGSYDMNLKDVEEVSPVMEEMYSSKPMLHKLEAVDMGTLSMPNFQATNLGFYQFAFSQHLPPRNWLVANVRLTNDRIKGTVRNSTPWRISMIQLYAHGLAFDARDLDPGESRSIDERGYPVSRTGVDVDSGMPIQGIASMLPDRILAYGQMRDIPAGPQPAQTSADSTVNLVENLGSAQP